MAEAAGGDRGTGVPEAGGQERPHPPQPLGASLVTLSGGATKFGSDQRPQKRNENGTCPITAKDQDRCCAWMTFPGDTEDQDEAGGGAGGLRPAGRSHQGQRSTTLRLY